MGSRVRCGREIGVSGRAYTGFGRHGHAATDSDGGEVETQKQRRGRPRAVGSDAVGRTTRRGRARVGTRDGRGHVHHPCSSRSHQTSSSRVGRSTWWSLLHGEGDADGKVHHEAQRAVRAGALEREVVAQLVVRQEQVSGDETPKGIRGEQQHGPRRVVPQPPGHRELEAHDGEDLRAGGPVRAIQVLDLRVLLEDLPPSLRVRLLWGRGLDVGERSASADVRIRDSGVTATRRRIRMAERWKHRNSDVAARAPSVAMRSGGRRDADVREWERGTDEGTYIILAPVEVTRLLRLELAARHGGRSFGPRASYDVTRKLDGRRRTAARRSDSRGFCARRDGCDTTDGSSEVVQMRVSGNEPRVTRSGAVGDPVVGSSNGTV